MPQELKTFYAIVGSGIAGIAAAEAIREVDSDKTLLLVNGEMKPPYCRPLIIEVLENERTFDEIHLRRERWFKDHNITLLTGDPAVKLDTEQKRLTLQSGVTVTWEKLLIATGSKPFLPPIKGVETVPAFTLYRQDDVERLKPLCKPGAKALLIGIGLIGLQTVTALKKIGVEVVAVEKMNKVLPLILDERAAAYAQQQIEKNGVEVRTGTTIKELKAADGQKHQYTALANGGEKILFDFLVLSAGMIPDLSCLSGTSIETGRGVKVSPSMEVNIPGIYAAGDITEYPNWIENRPEIHAHWVNAFHQGRIAGHSMAGKKTEPYEPIYLNSLDVFGLPMITMGASRLDSPEGAKVFISDVPTRPAYTRFVVRDKRLIAATFVNDVNHAGVLHYLMREKMEIEDLVESLLKQEHDGMEFLYKLHEEAVRGNVEWPESMDLIDRYQKDQSHTRWGKKKKH